MTNMKRMLTTAIAGLITAAANAQVPSPAPGQAPPPAPAQPAAPAPPGASLIDVYKLALDRDPAFKEAEAQYLATSQVKPLARSFLLPNLGLTGVVSHQYQDVPGGALSTTGIPAGNRSVLDRNVHGWGLSLSQTVFDWGQFKTLDQAGKRVAQAETTYEAAKQDLTTRVATRYFAVLQSEDNLASARSAREAISRQLEQAQRRFEVGLIAITDVQQSQAGYDTAVATEIQAQQTLATAHEFLREIIGEDIAKLAGPKEEFPLRTPDPTSPDEWVRRALSDNLTLNAQRIALEVANEQINIDRGSRYPKLTLSAGYTDQTQDTTQSLYFPPGSRYPVADDDQLVAVPDRQQLVAEPHVPALHGRIEQREDPDVGLQRASRAADPRADHAPDGAADARRVSTGGVRHLARARAEAIGRVESHRAARDRGGLRGRHADHGRRARGPERAAPRRDGLRAEPLQLSARRNGAQAGLGQLDRAGRDGGRQLPGVT